MKHLMPAALIALAIGSAAPAFADDDMSPARLQRLDAQAASLGYAITHAKAIEIAKANGLASIREIDLEDNAEWKVEGRDAQGRELEVELSARDGAVRKVERD